MPKSWLVMGLTLAATLGCASTETVGRGGETQTSTVATDFRRAPSVRRAALALGCMTQTAPTAQCAELAAWVHAPPRSLASAEVGTADALAERIHRQAIAEGLPEHARTSLGRWFVLGAAAAREAVLARAALTRATGGGPRSEPASEAEEIRRADDAAALRAHAHLAELARYGSEGDTFSPEAAATASALRQRRIASAQGAAPGIRETALAAVDATSRRVEPAVR